MNILGIESSCDETAAAVVKDGKIILSNIVASSADMHIKTGGIVPEVAARRQIESILPVINEALSAARATPRTVDALAVTVGPGLIGSLLVGVETAKTLSYSWQKPIVTVNHLVGHLYANWLQKPSPQLPAVGLVVSGGHTDLIIMKGHGKITRLGSTRDDAAGEAFDKVARLLGLPYPGGPSIANKASKLVGKAKLSLFPRPMINSKDFDFSFSGLKTAVVNKVKNKKLSEADVVRFSAELQEAVVDVLVTKTLRALEKYSPKSLLLSGGVAANSRLREKMFEKVAEVGVKMYIPEPELCTDNATYIASCANFNYTPTPWQKVVANPQLTIVQ